MTDLDDLDPGAVLFDRPMMERVCADCAGSGAGPLGQPCSVCSGSGLERPMTELRAICRLCGMKVAENETYPIRCEANAGGPHMASVFDIPPTDAAELARLWREEEVTDLDVDCPQVDYLRTAAAVLGRLTELEATLDPARLAKAWEKVVVDADRGGRWPIETWRRIAAEYAAASPSA